MYLNNLCKEIRSKGAEPSSVYSGAQSSKIPVERLQRIQRTLKCKLINYLLSQIAIKKTSDRFHCLFFP